MTLTETHCPLATYTRGVVRVRLARPHLATAPPGLEHPKSDARRANPQRRRRHSPGDSIFQRTPAAEDIHLNQLLVAAPHSPPESHAGRGEHITPRSFWGIRCLDTISSFPKMNQTLGLRGRFLQPVNFARRAILRETSALVCKRLSQWEIRIKIREA